MQISVNVVTVNHLTLWLNGLIVSEVRAKYVLSTSKGQIDQSKSPLYVDYNQKSAIKCHYNLAAICPSVANIISRAVIGSQCKA